MPAPWFPGRCRRRDGIEQAGRDEAGSHVVLVMSCSWTRSLAADRHHSEDWDGCSPPRKAIGRRPGRPLAALPAAEGTAVQINGHGDALPHHPRLPNMTGPPVSHLPNLSGDAARVRAPAENTLEWRLRRAHCDIEGGSAWAPEGLLVDYNGMRTAGW